MSLSTSSQKWGSVVPNVGQKAARPLPILTSFAKRGRNHEGPPSSYSDPAPQCASPLLREKEEEYGRERAIRSHRDREGRQGHPPHLREGCGLADHHVRHRRERPWLRTVSAGRRGRASGRDRPGGRSRGGLHLQERLLLGELHLALPLARPREGRQDLHRHPRPDAWSRRLRQLLPARHRPGHPHPRRERARHAPP